MNIDFTQGIISYPSSGSLQVFLSAAGGYVSFSAANGPTDIAFAHGDSTYLVSESVDVSNAWGPLTPAVTYWLYWDINPTTAVRTYGATAIAPIVSSSRPNAPAEDQHWFDTGNKKMNVFQSSRWREVIRVFAATVIGNTFSPLGAGFPLKPYAGTQVSITQPNTLAGRIIIDNVGRPVRRADGRFFTTEDDFFVNGSPITSVRLESGIITATAGANLAKFQVVKYSDFDTIVPASYNDIETTVIAIAMEDTTFGNTGAVCIQGHITNPAWNWSTIGVPLWISTGGDLTETDPHITAAASNPVPKAPVARVLSATSIIFDQGLGGKGDKGDPGSISNGLATNITAGISRLSVAAAVAGDPIVVGDNDPRNNNARTPTAHAQAATTITTATHGTLTGATLDLQLIQLEDGKVAKAGDTLTGPLILAANPTVPLGAATKQYVDNLPAPSLDGLSDVTITTPASGQVVSYNGSEWVNAPAVLISAANRFTKNQSVVPVEILNPTSPIAIDASASNMFHITLNGGAFVLSNPTNLQPGMVLTFEITTTVASTLTYDTGFKWAGGVVPAITATSGAVDVISCVVGVGGPNNLYSEMQNGFA